MSRPDEKTADAPIHGIGDSCLTQVIAFLDWKDHFNMMLVDKRCRAAASSAPSWDTVERVFDDRLMFDKSYDLKNFTLGFQVKPRCLCLCFFTMRDDGAKLLAQMGPNTRTTQLVMDNVRTESHTMIPPFLHCLPNLQYLVLSDCDMDEDTLTGLSTLRHLQHLEIHTDDHMCEPTNLRLHPNARSTLKHLHITMLSDPRPLLACLQGKSALTVLVLNSIYAIDVAVASTIASMESLTELVVQDCDGFTNAVMDTISTSPSLKTLSISDCCDFTPPALHRLLACNLELVELIRCAMCVNNCDRSDCDCNAEGPPLPEMVGNTRLLSSSISIHGEHTELISTTPRCQRWLASRTRRPRKIVQYIDLSSYLSSQGEWCNVD
jgi:hypothetical protein